MVPVGYEARWVPDRGVGYMDVVEALLPIEMQQKYFCQFLILKKYFIHQNINQSKNIYYI
jgi:hypothetical protein